MSVASTILAQLGGKRFVAMTGAKNFVGDGNSLIFDIPKFAGQPANRFRVTLDESDTYILESMRYDRKRLSLTVLAKAKGVYVNNLRQTFEGMTGLRASL